MECCWFCTQPLAQPKRPTDQHHLIPRRFLKQGVTPRWRNTVGSHTDCHQLWHRVYDAQAPPFEAFVEKMHALRWGQGVLAESTTFGS